MVTLKELWKNLTKDEKIEAAKISLIKENVPGNLKEKLVDVKECFEDMARTLRFRVKYFNNLSPADFLNRLELFINSVEDKDYGDILNRLLRNYILIKYNKMISDFLDGSGVKHQLGLFDEDESIEKDKFIKGINTIKKKYPERDCGLYFSYIMITAENEIAWKNLGEALNDSNFNYSAIIINQEKTSEITEKIITQNMIDSPEFTTLDGIIIKEIIASAIGQEGSLNRAQIDDLVDETVELQAARHKSFFHKGFMDAVFGLSYKFHFSGENELRRIWYLSGVIHGLYRQNKSDDILKIIMDNSDIIDQMKSSRHVGCIISVTHLTFDIYLAAGKFNALTSLINATFENDFCVNDQFKTLVFKVLDSGSDIIRQGKSLEAIELLKLLESRQKNLPNSIVSRLKRKMAQAYQMKGDLQYAKKIFEELLATSVEFEDRANTETDFALVNAGYSSLFNLVRLETPGQASSLKETLYSVFSILKETANKYGEQAVNANFCLGLYYFLEGNSISEAINFLETSLFGMEKKEKAYSYSGLIEWNRFLLGIALLESIQAENYAKAMVCIQKVLMAGVDFSQWLWLKALKAAAVYDDLTIAETISNQIKYSKKISPKEIFDAIGFDNILKIQSLLERFFEVSESGKIDKNYIFMGSKEMLEKSLQDGCDNEFEIALRILDGLEVWSEEDSETRKKFIELLEEKKNYNPAWSEHEAGNCLIRLYEKDGKNNNAVEILRKRFYERINSGDEIKRLDSVNILEKIKELKTESDENLTILNDMLVAKNLISEKVTNIDMPLSVNLSVYYIGGDETQASYQSDIFDYFKKKMPGLILDFYFPKWSSNWNHDYDNIKIKLENYDAIVLSPYIRTTLGQKIRKLCNDRKKHRYNCTGKGKNFIIRAIESAVKMEIMQ